MRRILIVFPLLLLSIPLLADAGSPIMWIEGGSILFLKAQVTVIVSEFIFFMLLVRNINKLTLLWFIFCSNVASTMAGIILLALCIFIFWGDFLLHPDGMHIAWLVLTYVISIIIEYFILKALFKNRRFPIPNSLFSITVGANTISYFFLFLTILYLLS